MEGSDASESPRAWDEERVRSEEREERCRGRGRGRLNLRARRASRKVGRFCKPMRMRPKRRERILVGWKNRKNRRTWGERGKREGREEKEERKKSLRGWKRRSWID